MICCGLPLSAEGYVDALRRPWEPAPASSRFWVTALVEHLHLSHDTEVNTLPTALVTGSPERVPEITIALKSAGFDILAAGVMSPEDAPDLAARSVDCYVQLPVDGPPTSGGALRRTRDVIAHEMLSRFEAAARFLPLLAPSATVVLVTEGPDPGDYAAGTADPGQKALRVLVGVLAEAILRDCGGAGVRATVVGEDRAPEEIAALASHRPPESLPWWLYASVDPELDFADWRNSVLCLASLRNT